MLQVIINDTQIDLSDDVAITLVWRNPFFEADGIPTPYSLSWSVPRTSRNLAAIGHADRTGAAPTADKARYLILFDGIELSRGEAVIESIGKDGIELSCTSDNVLPYCSRSLHEIDLGRISFGRLDLSIQPWPAGYIDTSAAWRTYTGYWTARLTESAPDLVAPTMRIQGEEWIAPTEADGTNPTVNRRSWRINDYGPGGYGSRTADYSKVLPSVRMGYLLSKIDPALGAAFGAPHVRRLYLCPTYYPTYTTGPRSPVWSLDRTTGDVYLSLADLMPRINVGEFVCDCLKLLCASLYVVGGRTVVAMRDEVLDSAEVLDLTGKVIGRPTTLFERSQKYAVSFDSVETAETIEADRVIREAASVSAMVYSYRLQLSDAYPIETVRIKDTGEIYETVPNARLSGEVRTHMDYKLLLDGDDPTPDSGADERDSFEVQIGLRPVRMVVATEMLADNEMTPAFNANGHSTHNYLYCPEVEVNLKERPATAYIGTYLGMRDVFGYGALHRYPYLTSGNRDRDGKIDPAAMSLRLDNSAGSILARHDRFRRWVESPKKVLQLDALLSPLDLHALDLRRKVYYEGRAMIVREVSAVVRLRSIDPAQIEAVSC